jgi:hypothetical protein
MRALTVGLIMFAVGWGFTEFLAASLQEYQTIPHRPDARWVPEQAVRNAAWQLADYGARARPRAHERPLHRVVGSPPLAAENSATCGELALPAGGVC